MNLMNPKFSCVFLPVMTIYVVRQDDQNSNEKTDCSSLDGHIMQDMTTDDWRA